MRNNYFSVSNLVVAALICMLMLGSAAAATWLTPTVRLADQRAALRLEDVIPPTFSRWRTDSSIQVAVINPQLQAKLDSLYNQVLTRNYINDRGERIMLSIAYGSDQRDNMQVHRPEFCYPAQGFQLFRGQTTTLATRFGAVPVKRWVAQQGTRVEPITYWITVGDQVTRTDWERKRAQLHYGLSGIIPDGLLFRVSSIGGDEAEEYRLQQNFIDDLLNAIPSDQRIRLAGVQGI